MKKEELIQGKKYKSLAGKIFTFKKFGELSERPLFMRETKGLIAWDLKDALENLTPIEDPEKILICRKAKAFILEGKSGCVNV
jgi:hypothetical protein